MKIAVILFAYNRPKYLKKAIKTHKKVEGLNYYAFVDKSDKQKEVIGIIHDSQVYDVIIPRQEHYGLNRNIIEGINWVFLNHDAVIVLEDDLLLSKDAIEWLKVFLRYYRDRIEWRDYDQIFCISADKGTPDNEQFKCWAWGIWKDRWEKIDWSCRSDRANRDSWDVVLDAYMRQAGLFCFCSDKKRVKHIGKIGTHYNFTGYIKERIESLIH